jgi:ribose transport system substrate-binding protein
MSTWKTARKVALLTLVFALVASACGGEEPTARQTPQPAVSEPSLDFRGPNGEVPTPAEELTLTPEELEQVQAGNFTAALVWHENSVFVQTIEAGLRDKFRELGIEVVASTSADFDAARQAANVETVLALDPDIIATIVVDPVTAAEAFRPAVDRGVKLVILTVPPDGYKNGEDFVGIVTGQATGYGKEAAEILGEAMGGTGKVGWIYHDANFWFTNARDQAFKDWLQFLYPDIEIVAEEGMADPNRTEDITTAMITRHPDLGGIYAPWAVPATGVLAALRAAGRSDIKVVTHDLDPDLTIDMLEGGSIVGIIANKTFEAGQTLALVAAYGVLEKDAPDMAVFPPLGVTADNVVQGWQAEFNEEPPPEVQAALEG